jgi:hypothetical protein
MLNPAKDLIRINTILTKEIFSTFTKDANTNYAGNKSYLMRKILGEYYGIEHVIPRHKEDRSELES